MSLSKQRLHADFPYLSERCYLNTAAAGISWKGQGDAAARFYDVAKSRGINGRDDWQKQASEAVDRLRGLLGGFTGYIDYFSNTTEVLNLVSHSMAFGPGDQIVLAADEFPSVVHAWDHAIARGVRAVRVPIETEGSRTATLCAAISERTRVVAVSHVHWSTGTVVDLRALANRCRQFDALLVVDGIQALGAMPVNIEDVDVYCGAVFKWLLSGFGLSVAAISKRALSRFSPSFVGYANEPPASGLRYAHLNYPAVYVLNATLGHLGDYGWSEIYQQVARNGQRLADGVAALGYSVKAPADQRAGIVSFATADAELLRDVLARRGIDVEARFGLLRCSPHFYNTNEDVDTLLDALRKL